MEYPWPFHKLICTEQEVNPQYRKLQDKGRKKSQRYRIYPHINGIADQSELRITACAEYPADSYYLPAGKEYQYEYAPEPSGT